MSLGVGRDVIGCREGWHWVLCLVTSCVISVIVTYAG